MRPLLTPYATRPPDNMAHRNGRRSVGSGRRVRIEPTVQQLVRWVQDQSRLAGMADLARLVAQLQPALGRRSAYLDLADGLRTLIMDGRLVVGDRLPPQRTLAGALNLS